MESCTYEHMNDIKFADDNISWRCFLKQLLVCSVVWMGFFICGLCMGTPTVLIPQIRKEANSTDAVSEEMEVWLSAILGYGCIPWVVMIPIATGYYGRKIPLIIISLSTVVAVLIFYLSNTLILILISETMESINGAATSTILIMIVTEYTSPKYRGFFISFKSATMFWGLWVSNALGTFFHWKCIGIVKLVCSTYALVAAFFIPESPYWLASKGKFEKCAESHRWLKGERSEMELENLIKWQKDYISTKTSSPFSLTRTGTIFLTKEFYKPTFLAILLFALYYSSGKLACTFYSLDIITKITASEKAAYIGMLILDGITVLSMYVGTGLAKCFRRRTLLLTSSSVGVMFLFILSLYMYLIKLSYVMENHIVSLFFLVCYSLGICCGPMLLAPAINNEIIPLRHRGLSLFVIAIFDNIMMGITIQSLPYITKKLGLEFSFVFFGLLSTACIVLLYRLLPETKDKTLQEITDIIMGTDRSTQDETTVLQNHQS